VPMSYDYIIVGLGAAGSVLANRLSANENNSVLVLEAGHPSQAAVNGKDVVVTEIITDPNTKKAHLGRQLTRFDVPLFWWAMPWTASAYDLGYLFDVPNGVPPTGRLWGGNSMWTAMIFMRPIKHDIDKWNVSGWSWEELLPQYKALESYQGPGSENAGVHGSDGITLIKYIDYKEDTLGKLFVDAALNSGFTLNEDFNGPNREGVGNYCFNIRDGVRDSSLVAYLAPAQNRKNLTIKSGATVSRVLFDGNVAVGVEYVTEDGKTHQVKAQKEVIITAGAILTPKILLLSGIGPKKHLTEVGVNVVADVPGVGANLQDHAVLNMAWLYGNADYPSFWHADNFISQEYALNKRGPMANPAVVAGGFIRTSRDEASPDIQYTVFPRNWVSGPIQYNGKPDAFTISVIRSNPLSRGSILLNDNNPNSMIKFVTPFNDNMNSDDIAHMVKGIRELRKIVSHFPKEHQGTELQPGIATASDAEITTFIKEKAVMMGHPSGTAKLGRDDDPMAVVDSRLRVRGVKGLRVADASVMPILTTGNIYASVLLFAERASKYILEDN